MVSEDDGDGGEDEGGEFSSSDVSRSNQRYIPKPKRFRAQGDGYANPLQRGQWSGEIKHRNF